MYLQNYLAKQLGNKTATNASNDSGTGQASGGSGTGSGTGQPTSGATGGVAVGDSGNQPLPQGTQQTNSLMAALYNTKNQNVNTGGSSGTGSGQTDAAPAQAAPAPPSNSIADILKTNQRLETMAGAGVTGHDSAGRVNQSSVIMQSTVAPKHPGAPGQDRKMMDSSDDSDTEYPNKQQRQATTKAEDGGMKNEMVNNMNNLNIKGEEQIPGSGQDKSKFDMMGGMQMNAQNPKMENQNQPMQDDSDNRPKWNKPEETVSKLTPQQLAMPRISVYVTVPDKGQKFLAYLDRRVHHTVKDFKLYLGQSIQIDDTEKVTLTKELIRYQPPVPITDLCMVNHQDKLVLRKDEWFLGRPQCVPYCLKPPEATKMPDGTQVYLRPFSFQTENGGQDFYNIVKREGDQNSEAYPIENLQPIFQVMRNHTRQNPRFATLFRCENENTVIKTENGYIPQIKPKYLELSTQIKNLILQKLEEQREDDELPEGVPRPKRPQGNTIIERYIDRQREEAEAELKYAKTIILAGFKAWDSWVPMPYPHRELNFARKMYMRGDNLLVQSPDFHEFCNDIKYISNKNTLIWKVKKMAMDRGFRGKLSMQQNDGKSHTVIMICNKSGKSTAKNPSIKAECPFLLHFERKSFLQKELRKKGVKILNDPHMKNQGFVKNEEGGDEESILNSGIKKGDFNAKQFKKNLDMKPSRTLKRDPNNPYDQVDIPGDPYFLAKYRSFHNHDLDCNYVEHAHLVMDEDLHKKGSANLLPQGPCAIQWLSGQRRKEIPDEGKLPEMPIQFDQITTVQTVYKLDQFGVDQNHQQLRCIEPAGMPPCMFVIDQVSPPQDQQQAFANTDDSGQVSWPPIDGMLQEARSLIVQTMRICLDDVAIRLGDGRYNLDRWRRILTYMKPKAFAKAITADSCFKKNPSTGRLLGLTPAAIAELSGGAARARLALKEAHGISNLVNQIQSKNKRGPEADPIRRKKIHNDRDSENEEEESGVHKFSDPDKNQMMNNEDGLVAPDDETYNIYN